MLHLAAFYESEDKGGALTAIAAVQDPTIFTSGDDLRVPEDLTNIVGEAALTGATTITRAQIESPSLRTTNNLDIEPVVDGIVFGNEPEIILHPQNPIPVSASEDINFLFNTDHASAIGHYGLVWFADGALQPVNGEIYSIRATAAAGLSAGEWVNSNLTFAQNLPIGRYAIVGMRARGTNLVASRLVFVGGIHRPGVPAVNAISDRDDQRFRHGKMGLFGEFHTNTPPTVDCLGVTDSTQDFIFDIIRLG